MNDLSNVKFKSGLTYDESVLLAEKYVEKYGRINYEWMAKKYLGELIREVPMWRSIVNDLLKEAK